MVLSQLGAQGTFVVMLYHMYQLTGSTAQVGLVGAAQGLAILILSPLGGYCADRFDRKLLLQLSQATSLTASGSLAILTLAGAEQPWHLLLCAMIISGAATFDNPVRKAIIPAMLPRDELVRGFALMNPTQQIARLVGPGMGGVLIAVGGPGLMYVLDTLTYAGLIVLVGVLRIPHIPPSATALHIWSSIREGLAFVRRRPLILHLLALDLSAMLFASFRVLLPALAVDVLDVGPTGYGILAAAAPIGALVGGLIVYRVAAMSAPAGRIIIGSTIAYGASAVLLGRASNFFFALLATGALGFFDAVGTTLRHAAILLETPDELLGRVSSFSTMATSGGPALGELNMGWMSGVLGLATALTLGGLVPILYATGVGLTSRSVREYRTGTVAAS